MDEASLVLSEQELAWARQARQSGNEGRARVCARRAAGWALAGYYARARGEAASGNAYQALRRCAADVTFPEEVRQAAARLTIPVDREFALPHKQDPLDDATLILGVLSDKRQDRSS